LSSFLHASFVKERLTAWQEISIGGNTCKVKGITSDTEHYIEMLLSLIWGTSPRFLKNSWFMARSLCFNFDSLNLRKFYEWVPVMHITETENDFFEESVILASTKS